MKQYKLSIIAAVYNLEKYLPRCLDSLVNQTLQEIEIICVDDGSIDSAPQIIDEYAKKYPEKVKAFHKKNGGEFTTRNYGLERATGEYVTFVDTDDCVESNWAEKLYNSAKENDADLAVCGFDRIDLKTNKVVATNMTKFKNCVKELNSQDSFIAFINPSPWNKVYKREKVKDIKFLSFRGFNDMIFLLSSYINIKRIVFVPDVLYHYYLRYDSQIHSVNIDDIDNFKKYLLEVKEFYKKNNKYDDMKYVLDLMAFIHLGISVMYRASYYPGINIKNIIKETIEYLDKNFSTWRNSPFLTFRYSITKGIKHIGLWGISIMYKMNLYMLFIKIYRFLVDKLKIDIKF